MKIQHKITLIFSVLFYVPQLWAVNTYEDLQKAVDEQDTQSINAILDENPEFLNQKDIFKRTILHHAANSTTNLPESIASLIRKGADPMALDYNENTPLHLAVSRGSSLSVDALINTAREQGKPIDPNTIDKDGIAPLLSIISFSLMNISDKSRKSIIQALIKAGADPNVKYDYGEKTPLHVLVRVVSIEVLSSFFDVVQEAGKTVEVNAQDRYGNTPLHLAVREKKWDKIKTLIEQGASITVLDKQGKTPVHLLLDNFDPRTIDAFVKAAQAKQLKPLPIDLNTVDSNGQTHLHRATIKGAATLKAFFILEQYLQQKEALQEVLQIDAKDSKGNTPLQLVAESGDDAAMQLLAERGARFDIIKQSPTTSDLLDTVLEKHPPQTAWQFFKAAHNANQVGDIKVRLEKSVYLCPTENIKMLVRFACTVARIDISTKTFNQMLLNVAALPGGDSELIPWLIKEGADVNTTDNIGETPLHKACWEINNKMICALVLANANVNAKNNKNETPLQKILQSHQQIDRRPEALHALFSAAQKAGKTIEDDLGTLQQTSAYSLTDRVTQQLLPQLFSAQNKGETIPLLEQLSKSPTFLALRTEKIILAAVLITLASIGLEVAYKKREQFKVLWQKLKSKLVGQKPKKDARQAAPSIF